MNKCEVFSAAKVKTRDSIDHICLQSHGLKEIDELVIEVGPRFLVIILALFGQLGQIDQKDRLDLLVRGTRVTLESLTFSITPVSPQS
jgi:hypothetical protein